MRVAIVKLLAVVLLAVGVLLPAYSADAKVKPNKEAMQKFLTDWGKAKELKHKHTAIMSLPDGDSGVLEAYVTASAAPQWTLREAASVKVRGYSDGEDKDDYIDAMMKEKREEVRGQLLWNLGLLTSPSDTEWKAIRSVALNEKEPMRLRLLATRMLHQPVVMMNQLHQDICKSNFEALLALLKTLMDEKVAKKIDKDKNLRHLKWLVVFGLEKLTSEEWGDSVNGWEIWWEKNKSQPLKYRLDEKKTSEVSGVKVEGRTAVRKKVRRVTNTELILLPDLGQTPAIFDPYLHEFTQFFKLTYLELPDAAPIADKFPNNRDGTRDTGAYYYPMKKMGELFEQRRKAEGGTVGILTRGLHSFVAMELAANSPDGAAFMICVGAWGNFGEQKEAIGQLQSHKEPVLKWFGESLKYKREPPLNEFEQFEANDGGVRHLFSDPYNPDQFWMAYQGFDRKPRTLTSLIDTDYIFNGKNIEVPVLFIFGKDDVMYRKGTESALGKMFKKAKFVTMENVSRTPWLEDPVGFFDVFNAFMTEFKVWDKITKDEKDDKKGGKAEKDGKDDEKKVDKK